MSSQSQPEAQAESSAKRPSNTEERVEADSDVMLDSTTKLQENLTLLLLKPLDRAEDEDDSDYIPGPTPPTSESDEYDSEDSVDDDEDDWETCEDSAEEEEEALVVDAATTAHPIERTDVSKEVDQTSKISSDSENASKSESDDENLTLLLLPDARKPAPHSSSTSEGYGD